MNAIATLPAVLLPSDEQSVRELMDELAEIAREEQAAKEFMERLEREKVVDCPII